MILKNMNYLVRLKEKLPWKTFSDVFSWSLMPNGKTDINNRGGFSTDMKLIRDYLKLLDLLLAGDIEAYDYRSIKSESEEKIHRLEAKLTAFVTEMTNIEPSLNGAISNLLQLDVLCTNGSITQKRKIISSMVLKKLTFDGFNIELQRSTKQLLSCVCLTAL